jgi:hypothetical protein
VNSAAWFLGGWIVAGALEQRAVEDALYAAAEPNGLVGDDGDRRYRARHCAVLGPVCSSSSSWTSRRDDVRCRDRRGEWCGAEEFKPHALSPRHSSGDENVRPMAGREEIPSKFRIDDAGDKWAVRCPVCRRAWSVPKGPTPLNSENQRYLLDHLEAHRPVTRGYGLLGVEKEFFPHMLKDSSPLQRDPVTPLPDVVLRQLAKQFDITSREVGYWARGVKGPFEVESELREKLGWDAGKASLFVRALLDALRQ